MAAPTRESPQQIQHKIDDLKCRLFVYQRDIAHSNHNGNGDDATMALIGIGNLYYHKFCITGDSGDLQESLASWGRAMADEPFETGRLSAMWFRYADFLLDRVLQRTRDEQYLQQAYDLSEKLLSVCPTGSDDYRLAIILSTAVATQRFAVTQNIDWLALQRDLAAGPTTSIGSIDLQVEALTEGFGRSRAANDINTAIELAREAVKLSAPENKPRARYNLACVLTSHYEVLMKQEPLDAVENLAEAIALLEEALASMPPDFKFRSEFCNALGTMLMHKYERTSTFRTVLHPMMQQSLGGHGVGWFVHGIAVMKDAEQVLRTMPHAVSNATLAQHIWEVCSRGYFPGVEVAIPDHRADIDRAVEYLKQSLHTQQETLEGRAGNLFNLASALSTRHRDFQDLASKNDAIKAGMDGLGLPNAPPMIRASAGWVAAHCAEHDKNWVLAARLHREIMGLLPTIVSRSSSRRDYQDILRKVYGTSTNAAAAVLQSGGTPSEALEVLEGSRGIIASQLVICSQDDLENLARQHPEKSGRYRELRARVLQPGPVHPLGDAAQVAAFRAALASRQESENKLALLENEIRGLPGFSRFQLGMRPEDLVSQAQDCHIVYLNVSRLRCDAICIGASDMKVIPLPDMTLEEVKERARLLVGEDKITNVSNLNNFKGRNKSISDILQWLWTVAVKPVLGGLNLLALPGQHQKVEEMPHVVWIPTSYLSFFPIHAAGLPDINSKENTLSHVVSSYAVSARSLQTYASKTTPSTEIQALAIAMPQTPSYNNMRCRDLDIDREVSALQSAFPNSTRILSSPSRDQVLASLPEAHLVHFACHGVSQPQDPSNGALLLSGSSPSSASPLTVSDMASATHQGAYIAYLSACSTADSATVDLADESLHLASAFQLAGFSHVIGTLWEADDWAATEVAVEFYKQIKAAGEAPPFAVACALHRAVLKCREQDFGFPVTWAPFVHFGR